MNGIQRGYTKDFHRFLLTQVTVKKLSFFGIKQKVVFLNKTISQCFCFADDEVEVLVFVHGEQLPKSTDDVIKVRVTSHASSKDSSGNITLVCKTYTVDTCDDLAWVDRTRNRKIRLA